jgi:hypothetical protein
VTLLALRKKREEAFVEWRLTDGCSALAKNKTLAHDLFAFK